MGCGRYGVHVEEGGYMNRCSQLQVQLQFQPAVLSAIQTSTNNLKQQLHHVCNAEHKHWQSCRNSACIRSIWVASRYGPGQCLQGM